VLVIIEISYCTRCKENAHYSLRVVGYYWAITSLSLHFPKRC